jgi:hypothetical protein
VSDTGSLAVHVGVFVLGLPMGVVAALCGAGLWLRRGAAGPRPALLGLALAAGVVTALLGTGGVPPWPPIDTLHWIPFVAAAAFVALIPFDFKGFRGADWVAGALGAAVLAGGSVLVYRPLLSQAPGVGAFAAGNALLFVAPWVAFDRAAGRSPGPSDLAALTFTAVGGSVAAVLGHTAQISMILGAVAAALGAATVLSWRVPRLVPGHAATGVAYVTIAALVLYAFAYADLPVASALLVLLAPRAAAVAARSLGGFRALALAALVAALPGALASWLAFAAGDKPATADDSAPAEMEF